MRAYALHGQPHARSWAVRKKEVRKQYVGLHAALELARTTQACMHTRRFTHAARAGLVAYTLAKRLFIKPG